MKHAIYLLLLCICTISCKTQTNNYAVISGTIHVKGIDSIYLGNDATNFKKAIAVNNGSFNDTITTDKIKFYGLKAGSKWCYLYLQNGYNLNVSITDSITSFSGVGADVNSYYKAKLKFIMVNDAAKKLNDRRIYNKTSEQDFVTLVNKKYDGISTILKNSQIEDKNFRAFEKENISWEKAGTLRSYSKVNTRIASRDTTKTYTPSPGFLPQNLLNFKSDNEDLYINSFSYNAISRSILKQKVYSKLPNTDSIDEKIKLVDSICNTVDIIYLKDDLLKHFGKSFVLDKDKKIAKTYLDYFTSRLSDENIKTDLLSRYNKNREVINTRQGLKKGAPSPKFIDYKNFAGGTTSLDDFKGKYVYIDVWATWCGPCKKEIPFLQDVEKKYHNKNIEFVSISIDQKSAYNVWKKMVADKQLGGVQLVADNAFESQFIKDYGIDLIPRFILIDPEGKIIDSNAPRPSYPELTVLLDGLLGK